MKDKGNHYYYYNGGEGLGKWEKLGLVGFDWVRFGHIRQIIFNCKPLSYKELEFGSPS